MSVIEFDTVEVIEGDDAPDVTSDDLKIIEAVSLPARGVEEGVALVEAFASEDRAEELAEAVRSGRALVVDLIRPCVGRGRGKHLYKAEMLEANADKFGGWKMYLNHLSDAARRALGGLPRDVRDLGGVVQESWWNGEVPAAGRFGKGAVQGVVSPVPLIRELVSVDPRLVESSINATATGCKPGRVGGEKVWIVEGIEDKGSVDWVTEAGAGGRISSIMEAMIEDGSAVTGVLDTLDSGTILAWIESHRPDLAEAMGPKFGSPAWEAKYGKGKKKKASGDADDNEPEGDDSDAEDIAEMAKKLLSSGAAKSQAQAVAMAKNAVAKKKSGGNSGGKGVSESASEGDEVAEITSEALADALASEEGQVALATAVAPAVVEAVRSLDLGSEVVSLVEAKLGEDREVITATAEARADRRNELRDLRDHAHRTINESRLTPTLKEKAREKFDIAEGVPASGLDLVDDEDENGEVVKSAKAKLDEAVAVEIQDGQRIMAEVNPTRVRGQGPTSGTLAEGEGGEGEGGEAKPDTVGPATRSLLEGAGVKADPEEVFARSL